MTRALFQYLNDLNLQQAENDQIISDELKQGINSIDKKIMALECKLTEKELFHLQDMHNYIYTNPYLKTPSAKKGTFDRYLEIYKKNHGEDLDKSVNCHHDDAENDVTLMQALENYINSQTFY